MPSRSIAGYSAPSQPWDILCHVPLCPSSTGQSRDICPSLYLPVLCKEPTFFWRVQISQRRKQPCKRLAVGEKHFQGCASPAGPCPKDTGLWKEPCPVCMAGARFPPVAESCHSRNRQLPVMLCKEQVSCAKTASPETGMEITSYLLPGNAKVLRESLPNCCTQ